MRKATIYIICVFLGMLMGASCIDRPDYVLDEDRMVDLLVDVHKAEGLMEMQLDHGIDQDYQKSVMAAVFVEHGTSREQYDSSLMWYASHLKLLIRVYSHVEERLLEEHDRWSTLATDSRDFVTSDPGDSIELWTMRDFLVLDRHRSLNRRFWELESDSNFHKGDTLRWSFDVNHLIDGQKLVASVSFSRDNQDKSLANVNLDVREHLKSFPVGQTTQIIDKNGSQAITAVPDSMQGFANAYLSIVLVAPDSAKQQSPVFLNNISLMRYHCE